MFSRQVLAMTSLSYISVGTGIAASGRVSDAPPELARTYKGRDQ